MGIRQTRGILRRSLRGHLYRSVSLHAHIDSGRHAHVHRYARDVGDASRSRRRRTSPEVVGIPARGQPGNGASAEELGSRGFPAGHGFDLSARYAAIVSSENLEAAASIQRFSDRAVDRGTLAHTRHAAEPSVFRFHFPQRPGPISRISLVLFHERASASLLEFALSAGLQHGSPALFLAASSCLAISVERVSTRDRKAFI